MIAAVIRRFVLSRRVNTADTRAKMKRVRWITAWRVGALMAVAAVALANVIHTVQKVPPAAIDAPGVWGDPVVWHDLRLAAFRQGAQARGLRGTIGYFGEPARFDDDFFYAQFALVPLVLDVEPERHLWAVANLRTSSPQTRLPAGWSVVEDFGGGVFLVRKSTP